MKMFYLIFFLTGTKPFEVSVDRQFKCSQNVGYHYSSSEC